MIEQADHWDSAYRRRLPASVVCLLVIPLIGASVYANLSFVVGDETTFKYFPPFTANRDVNNNRHLGGEHFHIAKSIIAGKGFADPFGAETGPTAWMPPMLPTI